MLVCLEGRQIEAAIRLNTRYVSLTHPHSPGGVMTSAAKLRAIVALAEKKGCFRLFGETYREMAFGKMPPVPATLNPVLPASRHCKTYGIPGIRIGRSIYCGSRLMQLYFAAEEQIGISGSMIDESGGQIVLSRRRDWVQPNNLRYARASSW